MSARDIEDLSGEEAKRILEFVAKYLDVMAEDAERSAEENPAVYAHSYFAGAKQQAKLIRDTVRAKIEARD